MPSKPPDAFLSYTRFDDRHDGGAISEFRQRLASAVRAVTGEVFEIFQDVDGIGLGEHWPDKLDEMLRQARFFIPILTPSYFRSKACRDELEKFLRAEQRAGRDDLVLPIYYIRSPVLDEEELRKADALATIVHERQRWDWRDLRHYSFGTRKIRLEIEALAGEIDKVRRQAMPKTEGALADGGPDRSVAIALPDRAPATTFALPKAPSQDLTIGQLTVIPLEEFTAQLPIAEVVGRHVGLTCRGGNMWGCCPFHEDKTPSFHVVADKGFYHCFGCGAHGNAVDFVMAIEGLDFAQAVNRLAELTGLPVPSQAGSPAAETRFEFKPGTTFRDVDAPWCPEMVIIPPGEFMMGSSDAELQWAVRQHATREWLEQEKPQHLVRIAYPFAVGVFPVTFEEYGHFALTTGREQPEDGGWGRGRRPVIRVSWNDAKAYLEWLASETRQPYRLLSEAEWEYVCRAGTSTRFWWGDTISPRNANYSDAKLGKTSEVGTYPASPWGLCDMHGNVLEWIEDCWNRNYEGAPNDGSAWTSGDCGRGVLRGGSWFCAPAALRAAHRSWASTVDRNLSVVGFRVARELTPIDALFFDYWNEKVSGRKRCEEPFYRLEPHASEVAMSARGGVAQ